ncbi:MAG TPA: choice-of-anchor Q domain-containing protein [Gemmataceae bacterium]|jgi:hypothetical protein
MPALGWPRRFPRRPPRGLASAVARADFLCLEARVLPAVFTVNSFADGADARPGDGVALTADGRVTLRAAIMEANALGGASTIVLPAGSYTLSLAGANEDAAATGDLDILAPITVRGAGSGTTTIHGDGSDRILDVRTGQTVTVQGVTLTGGNADVGGAVRANGGGTLNLNNVVLSGNTATADGGALAASGSETVNLNTALIQNNFAGGSGGGLFLDGATAIAFVATLAGNTAQGNGGGLAVVDSAGTNHGAAQFHQSTLSGNTAGRFGGGGYVAAGTIAFFTDTTVTLNRAGAAGGFFNAGGSFGLGNSIVAGNTGSDTPDVSGTVTSQGFNLVGIGSGASGFAGTDLVGTALAPIDPMLSPLILRGGATPVHVPTPGSPALDRGRAFATADQRGVARPATGSDIGSVEARAFGITSPSGGQHAAAGTAFASVKAVVTEGGQPLPGATVTFTAPATGPGGVFGVGGGQAATAQTDANGVAVAPTFTANFQAGSYSVKAVSGGVSVGIPLVNDPAPAGTLALTVTPPSAAAGTPLKLTVTALNPDGTRNLTYAGTVTFSTDATVAQLPGPYTFTSTDQGQKTFTVTLGSVGSHVIRVVDTTGAPGGQVSVTVTPVTNRFDVTAPATVNEGDPFSVTVTVRDAAGNVLTNYVGPVTVTSDDPRAVLPTGASFTASDGGVKTFTGLSLRPPGPRTITVTAADGTAGSASIGVVNFGPSGLVLTTDNSAISEGQAVTLSGTFFNPDLGDTHTIVVDWGDGSRSTVAADPPDAAGTFPFHATHTYTDDPAGPNDAYKIGVTVTDAAGGTATGATSETVTNVPPQLPPSGGLAVGNQGSPLNQAVAFTDPGSDSWTATVNYGDGTTQVIAVGPGRSFVLNHVYKAEGTFTVSVKLTDDDGGSSGLLERAVIFLPGTTGVKAILVPAGQARTLTIAGAEVTLDNEGGTTPAILLLGSVNLAALNGLTGSPTKDPTRLVAAYDIRVLDPGAASVLTAKLTYPNGVSGADPSVLYYDQAAGAFRSVKGSTALTGSFAVDKAGRRVTFLLDGTSTPTDLNLGGTVFTLSVPAPPPPQPQPSATAGSTPFFLASAAPGSAALAALGDTAVAAPIPTTGLVSSSTLTVAVSAAEGLRRGGGDETPAGRLVTTQTLTTVFKAVMEIRDYVVEALRMWLDQPAPMEAPAAVIPPPDTIDQVQLRQLTIDVAAATKTVEAAPPKPAEVQYEAVPLPPPAVEVDPVVATAETHPWWLKSYEHRSEPAADDPIPIPAAEPTDADRAAAGVTAVWLGGAALAAVAPEPPADDEEQYPPPAEDEDED